MLLLATLPPRCIHTVALDNDCTQKRNSASGKQLRRGCMNFITTGKLPHDDCIWQVVGVLAEKTKIDNFFENEKIQVHQLSQNTKGMIKNMMMKNMHHLSTTDFRRLGGTKYMPLT